MPQSPTVDAHGGMLPVSVGLVSKAGNQLVVERRAEALAVADHVADPYVEMAAQILRQAQRGAHLPEIVQYI